MGEKPLPDYATAQPDPDIDALKATRPDGTVWVIPNTSAAQQAEPKSAKELFTGMAPDGKPVKLLITSSHSRGRWLQAQGWLEQWRDTFIYTSPHWIAGASYCK